MSNFKLGLNLFCAYGPTSLARRSHAFTRACWLHVNRPYSRSSHFATFAHQASILMRLTASPQILSRKGAVCATHFYAMQHVKRFWICKTLVSYGENEAWVQIWKMAAAWIGLQVTSAWKLQCFFHVFHVNGLVSFNNSFNQWIIGVLTKAKANQFRWYQICIGWGSFVHFMGW